MKVQYFETKKNQKQVGQSAPVTGLFREASEIDHANIFASVTQ